MKKTILLSFLQIIWGALVCFAAWQLVLSKAGVPELGRPVSRPPGFELEFTLLILGFLTIIIGYFQNKRGTRFAIIQIILGFVISLFSVPFLIRASTLGWADYSVVYYIMYFLWIPGGIISMLGIVQIILAIIHRKTIIKVYATNLSPHFFAGAQMFFGVAFAFTSYNLAQIKTLARTFMNGTIGWVGMQNNASEILMLCLGAAIIICAVFQRRKQIKYAGFHIVVGIVIVIFSITQLLLVYTVPYAEIYRLYYLGYFIAVLAILVFGMGFLQLFMATKNRASRMADGTRYIN